MSAVTAYIGLGSNLHKPQQNIREAIQHIAQHEQIQLEQQSSLYRTAPMGYTQQDDFINAVIAVSTTLSAEQLLDFLLQLEQQFGRQRPFKDAPRTLDLDLLCYGLSQQHSARLTLPHPRLHSRAFVLVPLCEIAPDLLIPGQGPVKALLKQLEQDNLAQQLAPQHGVVKLS